MADSFDKLKAQKERIVRQQAELINKPIGCAIDKPLVAVADPFFENVEKLPPRRELEAERQTLIYWLLRAYQSGHREGWEDGPSSDETMDGLLSVLANRGYDPTLSDAAKELLKQPPKF